MQLYQEDLIEIYIHKQEFHKKYPLYIVEKLQEHLTYHAHLHGGEFINKIKSND
jgi:hypothetical protein